MTDNPCEVSGSQDEADAIASQYGGRMLQVSSSLLNGNLTLDQWHTTMQDAIRLAYLHQAIAGTPGADERELTADDYARLEASIADQYDYLDNFASDIQDAIAAGDSLDFVPSRADMYARSSESEYWKSAVQIDLPAVPRDGGTQCLSNCQCAWDLQCEYDDNGVAIAVNAYWQTESDKPCPDCEDHGNEWNPLRIEV